ncbi:putative lipase-like protein [Carp edema virus]|nr:putative lipase-like protein [Carp edema virus]
MNILFFTLLILQSFPLRYSKELGCITDLDEELRDSNFTRIVSSYEKITEKQTSVFYSEYSKEYSDYITLQIWQNGTHLKKLDVNKNGDIKEFFEDFKKIYKGNTNTVLIFHGFRNDISKQTGWIWINELAISGSLHSDYNTVVFVDWSRDAFRNLAVKYLEVLSKTVNPNSSTLSWLSKFTLELILFTNKVECWGHSLGSIMCSSLAKGLKENELPGFSRIIGFDTSGQNTEGIEYKGIINYMANKIMSIFGNIDLGKSYLHDIKKIDTDVIIIHSSKFPFIISGLYIQLGSTKIHGNVDIYLNWINGEDDYCSNLSLDCTFLTKFTCIHSNPIYFWIMLLKNNIVATSKISQQEYPNFDLTNPVEIIDHKIDGSLGNRILFTEVRRGVPKKFVLDPFLEKMDSVSILVFTKNNKRLGHAMCYPGICFGNDLYLGKEAFNITFSDITKTPKLKTEIIFLNSTKKQENVIYRFQGNEWRFISDKYYTKKPTLVIPNTPSFIQPFINLYFENLVFRYISNIILIILSLTTIVILIIGCITFRKKVLKHKVMFIFENPYENPYSIYYKNPYENSCLL